MTANWFEAKVKYMKVNEDGREKKVNEAYLLDAMSYTEAESRIMHEMESVISGDYYISSLKKSNITELVPSEDENDDRWYKAKVNIIDADEVSGKEKSTGQYYLVAASNINKALENLEKSKVNSNSPSLQIYGRINFFFLFRFRVLCRQTRSPGPVR